MRFKHLVRWFDVLVIWRSGDLTSWWFDVLVIWRFGDLTFRWSDVLMIRRSDDLTFWWSDVLMIWRSGDLSPENHWPLPSEAGVKSPLAIHREFALLLCPAGIGIFDYLSTWLPFDLITYRLDYVWITYRFYYRRSPQLVFDYLSIWLPTLQPLGFKG